MLKKKLDTLCIGLQKKLKIFEKNCFEFKKAPFLWIINVEITLKSRRREKKNRKKHYTRFLYAFYDKSFLDNSFQGNSKNQDINRKVSVLKKVFLKKNQIISKILSVTLLQRNIKLKKVGKFSDILQFCLKTKLNINFVLVPNFNKNYGFPTKRLIFCSRQKENCKKVRFFSLVSFLKIFLLKNLKKLSKLLSLKKLKEITGRRSDFFFKRENFTLNIYFLDHYSKNNTVSSFYCAFFKEQYFFLDFGFKIHTGVVSISKEKMFFGLPCLISFMMSEIHSSTILLRGQSRIFSSFSLKKQCTFFSKRLFFENSNVIKTRRFSVLGNERIISEINFNSGDWVYLRIFQDYYESKKTNNNSVSHSVFFMFNKNHRLVSSKFLNSPEELGKSPLKLRHKFDNFQRRIKLIISENIFRKKKMVFSKRTNNQPKFFKKCSPFFYFEKENFFNFLVLRKERFIFTKKNGLELKFFLMSLSKKNLLDFGHSFISKIRIIKLRGVYFLVFYSYSSDYKARVMRQNLGFSLVTRILKFEKNSYSRENILKKDLFSKIFALFLTRVDTEKPFSFNTPTLKNIIEKIPNKRKKNTKLGKLILTKKKLIFFTPKIAKNNSINLKTVLKFFIEEKKSVREMVFCPQFLRLSFKKEFAFLEKNKLFQNEFKWGEELNLILTEKKKVHDEDHNILVERNKFDSWVKNFEVFLYTLGVLIRRNFFKININMTLNAMISKKKIQMSFHSNFFSFFNIGTDMGVFSPQEIIFFYFERDNSESKSFDLTFFSQRPSFRINENLKTIYKLENVDTKNQIVVKKFCFLNKIPCFSGDLNVNWGVLLKLGNSKYSNGFHRGRKVYPLNPVELDPSFIFQQIVLSHRKKILNNQKATQSEKNEFLKKDLFLLDWEKIENSIEP